jgi:hypothetical protein
MRATRKEATNMNEEQRASPRIELEVPITVEKLGLAQAGETGPVVNTMTRNISAGGVYFQTLHDEDFRPGMRVSLRISMPHRSVPGHDRVSFSLVGRGTVVRIDPPAHQSDQGEPSEPPASGVAIRFDQALSFEDFRLV